MKSKNWYKKESIDEVVKDDRYLTIQDLKVEPVTFKNGIYEIMREYVANYFTKSEDYDNWNKIVLLIKLILSNFLLFNYIHQLIYELTKFIIHLCSIFICIFINKVSSTYWPFFNFQIQPRPQLP